MVVPARPARIRRALRGAGGSAAVAVYPDLPDERGAEDGLDRGAEYAAEITEDAGNIVVLPSL